MRRENEKRVNVLLNSIKHKEKLLELANKEIRVYVGGTGSGDSSVTLPPHFVEVLKSVINDTLNKSIKKMTAELETL